MRRFGEARNKQNQPPSLLERTHERESIWIPTAKSTVDAAMAIKKFVQESLDAGEATALISLEVQGSFDAA